MKKYHLDYQPCYDGLIKVIEVHAFGVLTWYVEIEWYNHTLGVYDGGITQRQLPLNWAYI